MLMNVRETKLANGLRIATIAVPHVESVSMGIWIGVGSRYESAAMSGASHFVEHLLFKGTKKRTARSISQAIEGRGGYLNAFTQEENTCYYARVAFDHMWTAADVLFDMVRNPRFEKTELEKERGVIVEEIMMYRDQPQQQVQDMLTQGLWQNHPLGRSVAGSPESVKGLGRSNLLAYKNRYYVPSNTVVVMAGRVDHEVCVEKVTRLMDRAGGSRKLPGYIRVTSDVRQERILLQKKEIEQAHLALGIRIFGRTDERRYALRILNAVLGENMSSRLFQVVREQHGLAYSIHSSAQLLEDSGALEISAGLDRSRTEKALDLILAQMVLLKERPVGPRELKRAKDFVIGQIRLGLESTTHQMMWLGDNLMTYREFISPEETIRRLSRVTSEEIQELACSMIRRNKVTLAMVAPGADGKEERRIRESLQRLA